MKKHIIITLITLIFTACATTSTSIQAVKTARTDKKYNNILIVPVGESIASYQISKKVAAELQSKCDNVKTTLSSDLPKAKNAKETFKYVNGLHVDSLLFVEPTGLNAYSGTYNISVPKVETASGYVGSQYFQANSYTTENMAIPYSTNVLTTNVWMSEFPSNNKMWTAVTSTTGDNYDSMVNSVGDKIVISLCETDLLNSSCKVNKDNAQ